jgi:hypothetical protein
VALGHDRKEEKASFPVPEVDEEGGGESGSLNGTWKLIKIMRNRKEREESVGGWWRRDELLQERDQGANRFDGGCRTPPPCICARVWWPMSFDIVGTSCWGETSSIQSKSRGCIGS